MNFANFYQYHQFNQAAENKIKQLTKIMNFAIFLVGMVQSISCNSIWDADLVTAIEELQSQKIDMQEIRKELDKFFQSDCDNFISEI